MVIEKSAALTELLHHRDAAYQLARRFCRNAADAEDIVQEAYLRAVQFGGEIRTGPQARTWLLRIVANAAKDHLATEASRRKRERNFGLERDSTQSQLHSNRQEVFDAIAQAMESLDEHLRLPVALHYEQGLSYGDAARILAVPEGTLRVYASRGLHVLRQRLGRAGYALAPLTIANMLGGGMGVATPAHLRQTLETIVLKHTAARGALTSARWKLTSFAPKAILAAVAITILALPSFPPAANAHPRNPASRLDRKVRAVYRRDFLSEVVADLDEQGVHGIVYPASLARAFTFSLEADSIPAQTVLEKLASAGGLELEQRDNLILLRKEGKTEPDDEFIRREAGRRLAQWNPDSKAMAGLISGLQDRDPQKQIDAARALVFYDDPCAVDAVIDWWKSDRSHFNSCSFDTGTFCCQHAHQVLEFLLTGSRAPEPSTRVTAAYMLCKTREPRAGQRLIEMLSDSDQSVRDSAAWGVGQLRESGALDPLVAFLKAQAARDVLVAFPAAEAVGQLRDPRLPEVLTPWLSDPDVHLRRQAIEALGKTRDPRAVDLLQPALNGPETRVAAESAIKELAAVDARARSVALAAGIALEPQE